MKFNLRLIIKLIKSCDYDKIDSAINQLVISNKNKYYLRILENTFIDKDGILWVNPKYVVTAPKQSFIDYAFWQIIGSAPANVLTKVKINRSRKKIRFRSYMSVLHHWHYIGKFPEAITNFNNLEELIIGDCDISFIPESIGKLNKLKSVTFHSKNLKSLPDSIGYLNELTELDLANCNLKYLPDSIGNNKNLENINLKSNCLSKLPNSFENIKALKNLNLSNNNFKVIPRSITKLPQLKSLYLNVNKIKFIGKEICNLKSLEKLNLNNNDLKKIPGNISKLCSLKELDFSFNKNLKKIEEGFSHLLNLEKILFLNCKQIFPKLTRKSFSNKNDINEYLRKLRRLYKKPFDDLPFKKKKPYYSSYNHYRNKSERKKSNLNPDIQSQVEYISQFIDSNDPNKFSAGLNLLESTENAQIFDNAISGLEISESGDLYFQDRDWENRNKKLNEIIALYKRNLEKGIVSEKFNPHKITAISIAYFFPDDLNNLSVFNNLKDLSIEFKNQKLENLNNNNLNLNSFEIKSLFQNDSKFINEFKFLKSLKIENLKCSTDLSFNNLNSIEHIHIENSEIERVEISECTNLKEVNIQAQGDSGETPFINQISIDNCVNLKLVKVSRTNCNNLSFTKCSNLESLEITRSKFKKLNIERCTRIESVYLNDSNISQSTIFISDPASIKIINLKNCSVEIIPQFVLESVNCNKLLLQENLLNELPEEIIKLKSLKHLSLIGNKFSLFPNVLCKIKSLEILNLGWQSNNSINGNSLKKIDPNIQNLTNLKSLTINWKETEVRKIRYLLKKVKISKSDRWSD